MRNFLRLVAPAAALLLALAGGAARADSAPPDKPAPAPVTTFKDCPDCPDMISIAPGKFVMGSTPEERTREGVIPKFYEREGPPHEVTIHKRFAMSQNEITRGMYARFVAETGRPDPETGCGAFDPETDTWHDRKPYSWRDPKFYQTDLHPAACLSYRDARDFASWLAKRTGKPYRLATEAEWEYAARAGTTTARYWGESATPVCVMANTITAETVHRLGDPKSWKNALVCTADRSYTQPVGSFPPNPWGLNDMIGNVYEYVADCYHDNYRGAPVDGSAWLDQGVCKEGYMLRGGAYYSTTWLARSAHRGGPVALDQHPSAAGIRVVRDLD